MENGKLEIFKAHALYYIVLRVRKHFHKGKRKIKLIIFNIQLSIFNLKNELTPHGGIAQLVEHLLCKQGVIGSNPFTSTKDSIHNS